MIEKKLRNLSTDIQNMYTVMSFVCSLTEGPRNLN